MVGENAKIMLVLVISDDNLRCCIVAVMLLVLILAMTMPVLLEF